MMNLFALILCYVIFAVALNSKRIEVAPNRLRILTKPLPFFGNRDFPRTEVREVLVKKNKHYPAESDSLFRAEIHLRLADGQTKPFILALRPKTKALEIKRWLERELGLAPSAEEV